MVSPPSPLHPGVIDEPAPGQTVPLGYLFVSGWTVSHPPVASIRVRLNGLPIAQARLGISRPDVASDINLPQAALCGFEAHVDITRRAELGPATIDAEVTQSDGNSYVIGSTGVEIVPAPDEEPPRAAPGTVAVAGDRSAPRGSPPRVLIFSHDLSRGGAQFRMLDYIRLMSGPGAPQFTVASQRGGPLAADLSALGIGIRILGEDGRESGDRYERQVERAARLIGDLQADVVWANTLASFSGVDAALRVGVPSLWFIHEGLDPCLFWGPELRSHRLAPHAYRRCLAALRATTVMVCVAEAAECTFRRHRSARIVVLRNSIDLASVRAYRATHDRQATRRRLGFNDDARVLLSCAPIVPHKGQAVLAQALAANAAVHRDIVCVMVGDIGHPYSQGIAAYAERAGLHGQLRLEPQVDDVYPWFEAADLFVLPSDDEALASVVLEAMAFCVPVVSTDVAGMPEVVEDGKTGFLCRSRDVVALSRALDRALSWHPASLRALASRALEYVEANHDIATRAWVLQELLSELGTPGAVPVGDPCDPDAVGADVAEAIATDLSLSGAGSGSVLHVGRGADAAFSLARRGCQVTSVALDIDAGTPAAWRRLSRSRPPGTAAARFDPSGLISQPGTPPVSYDAALLFSPWPWQGAAAEGDGPLELPVEVSGRVARAYVGVAAPPDESGEVKLPPGAALVASTVGTDCEPLRLYRVDL